MAQDPNTILSLERQVIESRFATEWAAVEPNVKVRYQNQPWESVTEPWVWFAIAFGVEEQAAWNGPDIRYLASSLVMVTAMTPERDGTDVGLLLASEAQHIFRRAILSVTGGGTIKFNQPLTPPPPSLDAGWWAQPVQMGFQSTRFFARA